MKRSLLIILAVCLALSVSSQTARTFTLNLTADGQAKMVCFLPEKPCGRAIVGIPGGGYSMLSNTHEGTQASGWLNQRGIAYFVVNYRLPNGDRTRPISDVEQGFRIVRDSSWASRLAAIWHQSSAPIRPSTYVLTSRYCSIRSSRWMSA